METFKPFFTVNGRTSVHGFRRVLLVCVLAIAVGWRMVDSGIEVECGGFGLCSERATGLAYLGGLIGVVFWTALICASVRRLHDADKSGWFALLNAIPVVNLGFWLWLAFEDGSLGENRYGSPSGPDEPVLK
jgi:uncharacterized membrane protein YhaH (DUF805 family)